ncbi:TetR/AcrR family transcriptional regulator C-terminal domain-containing protein [Kitasatospora sp. NA04385]|uniref:TetR/AcrR family transcriptional regulator n=1 Tax=Kitasatospora sp. NA04385 TaxID=2742135 RepID=UPI001591377A|nr:TetR/AcrR family transcriptional regulator C-terminal domain-containing protein [Kitasatospora sp. NA04385]QKW23712.1 TetR/AcrR family transcriptional regulator C-terminal domain-containing protein [Kitasatospora sp. NA04385]
MATKRASQVKKSVWLTPGPVRGRRSPRAGGGGAGGLDREVIVTAAVRLLDEAGEAKFSMRALAARLDVTPMSLYWYVADKDDLLELALDVVAGEMVLPEAGDGSDWESGLRALAVTWRAAMLAHPWAIRIYGDYLNIGPNSVRYSARALEIARASPLSGADSMAALSAIFQYTFGFTATEVNWAEKADQAGTTTDELVEEITEAVRDLPGVTDSGVLLERPREPDHLLRERDFHRALDWLLTGMRSSLP